MVLFAFPAALYEELGQGIDFGLETLYRLVSSNLRLIKLNPKMIHDVSFPHQIRFLVFEFGLQVQDVLIFYIMCQRWTSLSGRNLLFRDSSRIWV